MGGGNERGEGSARGGRRGAMQGERRGADEKMSRREMGRHGFVTPEKPDCSWEREGEHSWEEGTADSGERSLRRGEADAARLAETHCSSKIGVASNFSTAERGTSGRGRKFCSEVMRPAERTRSGFRNGEGLDWGVRHAEERESRNHARRRRSGAPRGSVAENRAHKYRCGMTRSLAGEGPVATIAEREERSLPFDSNRASECAEVKV